MLVFLTIGTDPGKYSNKIKLDVDPNTSRMTSPTDRNYEMEIEQFITFKKKFKQ